VRSPLTLPSADATDAAKFMKTIDDRKKTVELNQIFDMDAGAIDESQPTQVNSARHERFHATLRC
jgi:hypothetical protein